MMYSKTLKKGLLLLGICVYFGTTPAQAVPITYTNINHFSTLPDALSHLASELNLNSLMTLQNNINGLPNYFQLPGVIGQAADTAKTYMNVDQAIDAVNEATESVEDAKDALVEKISFSDFFFKKAYAGTPGSGFAKKKSSSSETVNQMNNMNPIDRLTKKKEIESICKNLKTVDGVKECFYLDNSKDLGSQEISDIHKHVIEGQNASIRSLYADSAAVVNATAKFENTKSKTTNDVPKTVSETLTKRAETDLGYNVISGAYLGLELSRLEMDSLLIYRTINSVKVDGGLF